MRRRPPPSCCADARERRGAACADLLPADSSSLPVKGCSSGRESGSLRKPGGQRLGSGQGLGRWRALRRRPLGSCCAGARERRGAATSTSYSKVCEFDSSNARCLSCRSTTPGTSRKSPVLVVSDANFATSGDTTFDDGTVMMCTRLVQLVARNSSVITLLIPR